MNKIWWKKVHNVLGLASALFLVLLLGTGILLNHPFLLERNEARVMAVDPGNSLKFYMARKDGLYRSLDAGANWEEVPILYPPQEVVAISFSPRGSDEIYLLERWGRILVSKDGGQVWNGIPLPFDPQSLGIECKTISVNSSGMILVLTSHGWISSGDGGRTWETKYLKKDARPLHRLILTIHNGYFFGPSFVWIYDFSAVALFVLIVSGLVLWKIGRSSGA